MSCCKLILTQNKLAWINMQLICKGNLVIAHISIAQIHDFVHREAHIDLLDT